MLYKINLPSCLPALEWVVKFQTDLLRSLCDNAVDSTKVTEDWVAALRPGISQEWIKKFCQWEKKEVTTLQRMQNIAALSEASKQKILQHFRDNLLYVDAFDPGKNPPPTVQLQHGMNEDADKKYRSFLEFFYDPIFYNQKGYPIDINGIENGTVRFHKDIFLDYFHQANDNLSVCPFCDGGLDGSQIDHWLAKKHFPELSCQPHNLIEICQACNSRSNKGENLTLAVGNARPFDDWFHPYLRPANGTFEIEIDPKGVPVFKTLNNQDAIRLSNLDKLINLKTRWAKEYRTQLKRIQKKIFGKKSRGEVFTNQSLHNLIIEWRDATHDEIGLKPNALLEETILSVASNETSYLFEELIDYAVD